MGVEEESVFLLDWLIMENARLISRSLLLMELHESGP
jgi:hypothetical protein